MFRSKLRGEFFQNKMIQNIKIDLDWVRLGPIGHTRLSAGARAKFYNWNNLPLALAGSRGCPSGPNLTQSKSFFLF